MGQEIRILLLHDQSLFREGLGRLLRDEPGFQIVGSCASTREALAALEREHADIVLVDYDVGEERGLDFVEELKKLGFDGRVLMVTARMSGGAVLRALERGTSGIFMRQSPPSELVKAIHRVVSGELWLDSAIFSLPSIGSPGTASRRLFYGPGMNNWDIALLKDTHLTESKVLEFRLETFNTFNHTQFFGANSVDGNINDSTFGQVISAMSPRLVQVSLKFRF